MARSNTIQPRTLKGFRDHLPDAMIARERLIDTARAVFRSFGYAPIDTPALEYAEILLGKGGDESDKQMYRFSDKGGRDVGLRFDLTVPLARFAAQHIGVLGTPFKRYHVATVWRGENTQRGRYREFMQCDFDTIGTKSPLADVETLLVIDRLLAELGFDRFTVSVNHRLVLNGVLDKLGLAGATGAVLRALDKLPKVGADKVIAEMCATAGATPEQARQVVDLASVTGSPEEVLAELEARVEGSEVGALGVAALRALVDGARAGGMPAERLRLDPSIARGLDYYTGVVYETLLDDLPGIGSVCSGGRYDDLASLYTKRQLPGVGASLGLDRLLAAMEELGLLSGATTPAPVFLPLFDASRQGDYLALAAGLRSAGIGVELYLEPSKLGAQLKYAGRRGFLFAVVVGPDEWAAGTCQLKDLRDRQSVTVALDELPAALRERL